MSHCDCGRPHGRHEHHGLPSRRKVVAMLSAAGAGAVLGGPKSLAQTAPGGEWIIDTHHHIYPPRFTTANLQRIVADSGALPASAYTG